MPDPSADGTTLPISAESDRERRRSSQVSVASYNQVHRRLPQLFSGHHDEGTHEDDDEDEDEDADTEESGPGFLGRVTSYRKLMHAHTKTQMDSPSNGTLHSYRKTMHHFTVNQLKHHHQMSTSETNSPSMGAKQSVLPSKMDNELSKLSLDEMPHGPSNTPEHGHRMEDVQGIDFRKLKRRSLTEPCMARDFAVVRSRDFAAASPAAAV